MTLAFVEACGGDPEQWRERWRRTANAAILPQPERQPELEPDPEPVAPERRTRRPLRLVSVAAAAVVLLIAAAIVVAATGAAPSRPANRSASRPTSRPTTSGSPAGLYKVIIANDCPPPPHATVTVETDPGDGWAVGTAGGYRGDGCYGEYLFQRDDTGVPANRRGGVHWRLTGAPAATMTCLLSVHIADSPHSAGPAGYTVSSAGPTPPTRTDVDQSRHRGDWIGLGSYPATAGTLEVDMRPPDGSPKEVTAGPVNVYCPAA